MNKSRRTTKRERNEALWGLLMVAPTIIGLIILNIYPIISTAWLSLCKTGDFGIGNTFVGLKNFQRLFKDTETWQSLFNTVKYAVLQVPFSIAIPLVIAFLLNTKMKGRTVYRVIFFLPMIVAPAAVAMVWRWMYNQDYGLINNLLGTKIGWITDPRIAWISVAIVGIWGAIGNNMILFLGGLQEIPRDYYEAARVDGASPTRIFFSITVPLLSPTIFFVVQTGIIGALQLFDLPFMIMDDTSRAYLHVKSITNMFYDYSFGVRADRGYGAAIVVFMLGVIGLITFLIQKTEKKWVFYNE